MTTSTARQLNWVNLVFLITAHLLAVAAVLWMVFDTFSWWTLGLGLLWLELCSLSITAGYHRLFSHRAYKAAGWFRFVTLLFGAASIQNSALAWSRGHRLHHAFTDTDKDPYNAKKGFLWSHVGWVVHRVPAVEGPSIKDLESDPLVMWQHRNYVLIATVVGALIPLALGFLWGDPIGALLVAGFLRLVVQWHMTFTINSLAHMVGTQPYSRKNTARDSSLIALISWGEGYHNFHHRFPSDYRNGVRWWHFDPTKWLVWGLSKVRQTKGLRRTPDHVIERAKETRDAEPTPLVTPAVALSSENRA